MIVMKNEGHVHEMLIKCCESEIISFHLLLVGHFWLKKVEVMVMFTTRTIFNMNIQENSHSFYFLLLE